MSTKPTLKTLLLIFCVATIAASCALFRPAPCGPAPPAVSELQYKSVENMRSEFGFVGGQGIEMSLKPRETLVAEPVYFSKRPLYGEIRLGDSEDRSYTIVIDESKGTRSGYDTLYIDANNNEDLTDDPKISGKALDDGNRTEFPSIEVTVSGGGQNYPYRLTPTIYSYQQTMVQWSPSGYCEGELRFGDKTYKIALFDFTCNGLFNDAYQQFRGTGPIYAFGDTMVMDLDGDGTFQKPYEETREVYYVGKYVSFGNTCYEMQIEPNGRKITVRQTDVPCGYIVTAKNGGSAELIGTDGAIRLNGPGSRAKVPAGEYRLAACNFEGKDENGAVWRIVGRGMWSQPPVQVNPNEKTSLMLGPPLKATVTTNKSGDSFAFALSIAGQGGETYSAGSFQQAGRPVPPPRLEIRNDKGEVVVRGNFQYG